MPARVAVRRFALPAVLAVAALFGATSARSVGRVALPAPAPGTFGGATGLRAPETDPEKENTRCASCHADIAAEWQGSLHQKAWSDPVFQQAYSIEPVAFCRGCHAPEADAAREPTLPAQTVGVGCTTCHVQAGDIVGAHAASAASPHAVFSDARMATREACGSCHQFDFPGEQTPMQNTLREHAGSSLAAVECQSCHMPMTAAASAGGRSHRSHAFAVISNPAMIRRAASVRAERVGARALTVTVAPAGAAHAFPTGDMFRRLEIVAEAVDAAGNVVARAEPVHLGRTFVDRPKDRPTSFAFHRIEADDTRVPAPGAGDPRVVELRFGRPVSGARLRWRVVYQRMATAMAASFRVDQAHDEIVVAEGELAAVAALSARGPDPAPVVVTQKEKER